MFSGKCRVLDDQNSEKPITLATLQKGDSFGEESLLLNKSVSKTIRASSTVILLKIPANTFHDLIAKFDEFHNLIKQRIQLHDEIRFESCWSNINIVLVRGKCESGSGSLLHDDN